MRANRKTNITLAVENKIITTIKQEAQIHKTSVNARVNRILNEYALFGKYFAESKPIMIAPKMFGHLLEKVDEKIWLETWEISLYELTPQVFAMHNLDFTLDNLINYLFGNIGIRIGAYDGIAYDYDEKEDTRKLVIKHKYGMKWSKILAVAFSNLLEKKFDCHVSFEVFSNSLVLTISNK